MSIASGFSAMMDAMTTTNSGKPIGRWPEETQASALISVTRQPLAMAGFNQRYCIAQRAIRDGWSSAREGGARLIGAVLRKASCDEKNVGSVCSLSPPFCGERVGVRGCSRENGEKLTRGSPPHP